MLIEHAQMDNAPLMAYLKSVMPAYMLPAKVVYVPSFPMNSSNKIDRSQLKKML